MPILTSFPAGINAPVTLLRVILNVSLPSLIVCYPLISWLGRDGVASVEPEALLPAFVTGSDLFRGDY